MGWLELQQPSWMMGWQQCVKNSKAARKKGPGLLIIMNRLLLDFVFKSQKETAVLCKPLLPFLLLMAKSNPNTEIRV